MKKEYPEHEKMSTIVDTSHRIGEFLEWLSDVKRYRVCKFLAGEYWPVKEDIEHLLAEYFEIDLRKLESEKREMLDEIIAESNMHG